MKKGLILQLRGLAIGIVGLMVVLLMTACSGFAGTNTSGNSITITGKITAVDAQHGTVSLDVNGQTYTISGLSASQEAALQGQVGKTYQISATQNSNGTYTINVGNNSIIVANQGATPGVQTETSGGNETPAANQAGTIQFTGKVLQVSGSSVVVAMPNGQPVTMSTNAQTDLGDFNGALPAVGQIIKAGANANTDGSFTATKLSTTDNLDNTVKYQGVTTSTVGSDNVLHFVVGNKSLSYTIISGADLKDFNNNAQSIGNNQAVKVEVQFQGSNGVVTKVSNLNG